MESWHGTTILGVKKGGRTVIAGDGQVSMGNTVMKPNARKVRRLGAEVTILQRGSQLLSREDEDIATAVRSAPELTSALLRKAKRHGFSDAQLAALDSGRAATRVVER